MKKTRPWSRGVGVWAFLLTFGFHLAANPHYGFFRDELYFIVCGRRLDWGYVDQPPLVPLLAAATQTFGVSLFALRAVPALCAAGMAATVCALAAEMGGGIFAQAAAAFAASASPVLLAFGTLLGPDTILLLLWPHGLLCAARGLHGAPRWLLAAGCVLGLAAQAKASTLFLAVSLAGGVALSPQRKTLLSPWLLAGVAAAVLINLPNALWQWAHGWPMLELLRNGQTGKNVVLSPLGFLGQQIALTNPALSLVWIGGLMGSLRRPNWRFLGATAILLLGLMIVLHGKAYYPASLYPALFAAGGVALEQAARRPWQRGAIAVLGVTLALPLVPLASPILPETRLFAYLNALRRLGVMPLPLENHRQPALGQMFADMHGWRDLAVQVARLREALPPDIRDKARIFAGNYGEAAAIDVLSPVKRPPVLSGHNQYYLWGPRDWDGTAVIDVAGNLDDDRKLCRSATLLGHFSAPWIMPYEDNADIILCVGLIQPVATLWPTVKHYE